LALVVFVFCLIFLRDRPQEKSQTDQVADTNKQAGWRYIYSLKDMWALGFVYIMWGLSYVLYTTFFHTFLTVEKSVPVTEAALMWSTVGFLSIFSSALWGGISDRLGRKYTLSLVYLLNAVSYSLFFFTDSVQGFFISAILFGLGLGSIPAIVMATAGDWVGPRLTPIAVGFLTVFFSVGQLISPTLGGYLADSTGSFRIIFIVAMSISLIGSIGSLLLKKPPPLKTE